MSEMSGYKGRAFDALKAHSARVWAKVDIETTKGVFTGIILPRAEQADDLHVVLKLNTGYNIGIAVENIKSIKELGYREAKYKIPEQEFPYDDSRKNLTLLGTGGTIASRLDYRTGAVIPAFSPGELYGAVPELADICNLKTEKLFGVFSENMSWEQYRILAEAIGREINRGADGIVIGHGTDTMHHTAAALSFMVQDSPVPVIMVGSQRSSDRPSSDAAFNLQCACNASANGEIAEVLVCMFGPTSDSYNLLHRGTRVRKMHSSYRSTFRTLSDIPVGMCTPDSVSPIKKVFKRRRNDRNVKIDTAYDDRVTIVYYYPGMKPDIIDSLVERGYKGIVIAGTGLGHVNKPLYDPLRRAIDSGVHVYMTVQTMWGFAQMYVYDTGRDLLDMGVQSADNMTPECAYIKLGWALGHSHDHDEVHKLMVADIINDEITEREPPDGYLVFQGGLPEIKEYLSKHIK